MYLYHGLLVMTPFFKVLNEKKKTVFDSENNILHLIGNWYIYTFLISEWVYSLATRSR